MVNDKLFKRILLAGLVVVLLIVGFQKITTKKSLKLYWFIPDGVRAEPNLFNVYKWAQEGKLPNIKKLMEQGSYGYSYPNFPSHTPTNFATLLTGSYPEIHGVNDGPMRALGKPLDKVAVPGFRSTAKKVPPIWKTLEEAGYKVGIISVPGSTPPEVNQGVVLRGRWGGWGADFHAINFETKGNLAQRIKQGSGTRLFYFGPQLTQYIDAQTPKGWLNPPQSYSAPMEVTLDAWGAKVYAYIYDSTDDLKKNYDKVSFSKDKQTIFANLTQGQWSDWEEITLKWQAEDKQVDVESDFRATVIKLDSDGFFRLRLFYNNLNSYITQPEEASEMVQKLTGPMVDFADNFPAQLIYYPEDKKTFEDEADMSFEWHKKAVSAIYEEFAPNVIIHDIYTPNQMLTTRWWMGYVDPVSARYGDVSDEEREKLWQEVQDMYKKLDDIVGEILKVSDKNTYIVFTSDHGAVPLDKNVFLNNLFAKNGWLKFTIDSLTGEPIIDWKNSKVIYLKMAHVYINPKGLDGNYQRASGPEYEKLRQQVIDTLESLKDTDGTKPLTEVVKWEDAKEFMQLDPERVGDLVIANAP
ncbi:hypothetical protein A2799_03085, partial [Candidatus Roizmanbacteria bacterium RIFCSPHIGHO2_01_FULL_39_24]